jgi:hypothetical protein
MMCALTQLSVSRAGPALAPARARVVNMLNVANTLTS